MLALTMRAMALAMLIGLLISSQHPFPAGFHPQVKALANDPFLLITDQRWQEEHPGCKLIVDDIEAIPPVVTVMGQHCVPDQGDCDLGILIVEGTEDDPGGCYSIRASGGLVIVDLIDPF